MIGGMDMGSYSNLMNINLEKHDIGLILDALESYQLDIEHGNENGHEYVWTTDEVDNLTKYLNGIMESSND
jgi:hypothetical protein